MPEMDQGLKWLVQTHPRDLLAFSVPGAEYLDTLPTELAAPQQILDTLLRVRYENEECAVDIEAEAQPRADIGKRLFKYGTRIVDTTDLPVISVVLWLQKHGKPPKSPYELRVGKRLIATWHFIGVELYNLEAEALLESGLAGLLPLVPFAHNGSDEAIIERAAFAIYDRAVATERADLEVLLGVFGARAIGRPTMQAILGRLPMSADLVKTSPLYQYWVEEGRVAGREEGREEGREVGREEGATQVARQSLLVVLRQRFPVLPPEVETAIARADLATTEAALAHAVTDSLEQIRERLGAPPA